MQTKHDLQSRLQQKDDQHNIMKRTATNAHMLWVEGNLSNLEILCINSFMAHGYTLTLWTYGKITNAPQGTIIEDARKILPEGRIFKYSNGSYAGFSNLFRYAVLSTTGGLWVDSDVVCLTSEQTLGTEPFLVTERMPGMSLLYNRFLNSKLRKKPSRTWKYTQLRKLKINPNVIYRPVPRKGDIVDLAFAVSDRFPADLQTWGDCGPILLTTFTLNYPQIAFKIMAPDFANSINYWSCPDDLLMPGKKIPEHAAFLHLYNEMWRRSDMDKNGAFPKNSIMDRLKKQYL